MMVKKITNPDSEKAAAYKLYDEIRDEIELKIVKRTLIKLIPILMYLSAAAILLFYIIKLHVFDFKDWAHVMIDIIVVTLISEIIRFNKDKTR